MAALEIIELDYANGDGPDSVLVKLATANEGNLAVAVAFDIYRREVLFYRDLADRITAGTLEGFRRPDRRSEQVRPDAGGSLGVSHRRPDRRLRPSRRTSMRGGARKTPRRVLGRRRPRRAEVHPARDSVGPRRCDARWSTCWLGSDGRDLRRHGSRGDARRKGPVPRSDPGDAAVECVSADNGHPRRFPDGQPLLRDRVAPRAGPGCRRHG